MTQTNTFNSINEVFNVYEEIIKRYPWVDDLTKDDYTNYDKVEKNASYFEAVRECKQFSNSISSSLSNKTLKLPSRRSKSYDRYNIMNNNLLCLEINNTINYISIIETFDKCNDNELFKTALTFINDYKTNNANADEFYLVIASLCDKIDSRLEKLGHTAQYELISIMLKLYSDYLYHVSRGNSAEAYTVLGWLENWIDTYDQKYTR